MSEPIPVDVWLVALDAAADWLPPTPSEAERAARFVPPQVGRRYLRSHAALRAILQRYIATPLEFGVAEHGKPHLPTVPGLRFNLSHSHEMALVAVAWDVEVGVDVEYLRPMPECMAIAQRFFPPTDAAALEDVRAKGPWYWTLRRGKRTRGGMERGTGRSWRRIRSRRGGDVSRNCRQSARLAALVESKQMLAVPALFRPWRTSIARFPVRLRSKSHRTAGRVSPHDGAKR